MTSTKLLAGVATLALLSSAAQAQLLSEDFNDGAAATRWSIAFQLESTRASTTGPDGSVDFAFDYSTLGIANPSGGSDTIGAFVQVNKTDQAGDEGETYVIFPNAMNFSGDLLIEADMFVYNDGGAGSTELGMIGLFLDNNNPVAPYQWGDAGGPLAWIYTGEGGSTADFATFEEGDASSTGYSALADYPAGPFADAAGPAATNPRGDWVKVAISVIGTDITWLVNGTVVDTYDNSGGFYTSGNIFLGATDPFNSANGGNGTIIDNVVVTQIPEPTTLALAAVGALAGFARRRRPIR